MINQRLLANIMRALLVIVSLLTLTIYGFPIVLKSKILAIIQQETGRKASLANLQFTLLPLSIQLQNVAIKESNGKPFVNFDSLYINVNTLQSLKQSVLVVDKITLVKPVVRLVKQKNGTFNVDDLFNNKANNQQSSLIFPILITNLSLSEGKLVWEDSSIKETIQPINLTITNFSTTANKKCQLLLQLSLNSGGHLDWQGELSLNPLLSTGHIKLNDIKLPHLLALSLPASIPFSLSGHALFASDYQVSYDDKKFTFTADKANLELHDFQYAEQDQLLIKAADFSHKTDIKIRYAHNNWLVSANNSKIDSHDLQLDYSNTHLKIPAITLETSIDSHSTDNSISVAIQQGKLNAHHAQLFEKGQAKPLVDILTLALQGVDFNLNNQELAIDSVQVDGADFHTWLNPKGTLNYQTLFATAETKVNNATTAASKTTPWAINVNHIAGSHLSATFEDRTQNKPIMMTLNPINFKLTGYSNKTGVKLPFQLDADINKTGSIQLDGDITLEPFSALLTVNANSIDIESFQPYLEKFARLDIIDGQLATNGKLAINLPENDQLDLKFTGDTSIAQFITRDQKQHKDFITWKKLTLKTLAIDLQKDRYTADELIIDKPYTRLIIKKDKTINFSDIFITDSPPPQPSKAPVKAIAQHQAYFKLSKVQVIDGSSDFADNSLILPFAAQIKSLDGGASDISSDQKSIVKVSLKGNAYDLAPVDIDGHVSPYLGDYDLTINFKGMPMPLISPYMVEFAGYKVEKGKMSLELKYKVINNKLTATNNILIDQFELGEKVENPHAVSLPLKLAVALLKDADGKMRINVPITGSLDDPQFDIGTVVTDALMNAISKVVSSPFRALAALTNSDEDMSTISFSAGNAVLDKTQYKKLTALAKILKERPVLILDIKGTAFQEQDWPTLREAALYDLLKKIRADELNQQSDKKILAEYVKLSDTDYKRLLATLFIEKFPKLAKKSLLGTPELINAKAGDFYEVAKQQLSATLKPEPPRLKELAAQRARAIANYLVQIGDVPNERIFILDTLIDPKIDHNELASLLSVKTN